MAKKSANPTGFRCKICKVPVVSRTNLKAVLGWTHSKHCPRRFK